MRRIELTEKEEAKSSLQSGDLLFARRSLVAEGAGRCSLIVEVSEPTVFESSIIRARPDPRKADSRYLHYFFSSPQGRELMMGILRQVAVAGITGSDLAELRVPLPNMEVQRGIAETLSNIDDRIDNLRQTNATLEAIAQALFKSWFVDFDPVHAKAEDREPEGMDAATAALFPSKFEDSELGPIPKGWQVRSLDSIANYLNGLALQKFPPESEAEYLPVIKIAQLRAGNTNSADKASARLKPEYIVEDGDVLFSWSGSLEVEIWCGGRGALNQHLFKVTSNEVPKWFYYFATRQHLPDFREIAAHKATTMGHIQRRHLAEAKVADSTDILEKLSTICEPLFERRVANSVQAKALSSVRDTLLPRLISGRLRLPEAEAVVEGLPV